MRGRAIDTSTVGVLFGSRSRKHGFLIKPKVTLYFWCLLTRSSQCVEHNDKIIFCTFDLGESLGIFSSVFTLSSAGTDVVFVVESLVSVRLIFGVFVEFSFLVISDWYVWCGGAWVFPSDCLVTSTGMGTTFTAEELLSCSFNEEAECSFEAEGFAITRGREGEGFKGEETGFKTTGSSLFFRAEADI